MKTKLILIPVLFLLTTFSSCQKGKASDEIHLSGRKFTFNWMGDSVVVTTKGTRWWIPNVFLDSTYIQLPQTTYECNFEYSDSDIQIVRKSCDTLFVKMNENRTNLPRKLFIGVEDGDYFDGLNITQNKE